MKAIRWQIPFASIGGTHYRIDIYDEQDGSWSGVQTLTGGTSPFATSEDDSDDYFAPIRTQSGTIEVCTLMPDGTYITLDDLLPANNIARPVRLINTDNSDAIEWQGFLSCEAYDQDYTGIPQILQLPVIGVLEAMDSVEIELDEDKAFLRVLGHVCNAMKEIETKSGISNLWGNMYISEYCVYEMMSKFFYNNVYLSTEELVVGENISVEVHSISGKELLEQVAQFFGGCWREKGRDLYFEVIGKTNPYLYTDFATIYGEVIGGEMPSEWDETNVVTSNANDLYWHGTDHKLTVLQGAKRVRVAAQLKDFECKISLRECPIGWLVENPEARQSQWGEVHVNTNETFYSLAEHRHLMSFVAVEPYSENPMGKIARIKRGNLMSSIGYQLTWPWATDFYLQHYEELFHQSGYYTTGDAQHVCTTFMAWMRCKGSSEEEGTGTLTSGLMVCGLPNQYVYSPQYSMAISWYYLTQNDYIFRQSTPMIFAASRGSFQLEMEFKTVTSNIRKYDVYELESTAPQSTDASRGLTIAIKWGNKWASYNIQTGYGWSDNFFVLGARERKEDDKFKGKVKITIPINGLNVGIVSIYIFPHMYGYFEFYSGQYQDVHNIFVSKMDLKYIKPSEELLSDRSENIYAKDLGTAFRDEIKTDVDIATYANNTKLATMLWESDGRTPVTLLTLDSVQVRPEVDLLNRLAEYYQAARHRLSLIVAHPTAAPLPLLRLNGISPDNRKYLPLAEERDWQQETCTLTCFETPTETQESQS